MIRSFPKSIVVATVLMLFATSALASDKEIIKTANVTSVGIGGTVEWTLLVKNTSTASGGPFDTPNAVVTDNIPSAFSIVSATSTQGSCSISSQTVTCSLGTLAANTTVTITIVTTAVLGGTHENTASIVSGSFDPNSANNTSEAVVIVTEPKADLTIEKTVSPTVVDTDSTATFTIVVTNNGPDEATGVRIGDDLSAIFTSATISTTQGTCTMDAANIVDCALGTIGSGASVTITIPTTASVAGIYTNTASVVGDVADPVSTNNTNSATITVQDNEADISVTKVANPMRAKSGQDVIYTITVTNNGPKPAEGVKMEDNLPLGRDGGFGVEFVSSTPSSDCSHANGKITCEAGAMAAGESKVFTITTYVTSESKLSNTADVTSTSPEDPDPSNNSSTIEVDARSGSSTGDNEDSGDSADPVNVLSGEFFFDEDPDTEIPWAARLSFERFYASFLDRDGVTAEPLGPNWTHSHNWGFFRDQNFIEVRSPRGRTWGFRQISSQWTLIGSSGAFSLTETAANQFVFADMNSRRVVQFTNGQLSAVSNEGVTTSYEWSGDSLTCLYDALGNNLVLTYTGDVITSISSGLETINYSYSGGLLTGVSMPGGVTLSYEYATGSIAGLLTARRLTSGISRTEQTYDSEGRVASQTDAGGGTTSFAYGSSGTVVTYGDGSTATYVHNADGQLTAITMQDGTTSEIAYGASGRGEVTTVDGTSQITRDPNSQLVTRVVDPLIGSIEATYTTISRFGAPVSLVSTATFQDGTTLSYGYDAAGRVTSYSDGRGPNWTYVYDSNGLISSATSSAGATSSFVYNANGSLASVTNELGQVTRYQYDAAGRTTVIEHPDGTQTQRQFDAAGRILTETDGSGVTTSYTYDADGQVTAVTDALQNSTTFSYDNMGRLTRVTDAMGYATSVAYSVMGDLISVTGQDGAQTSYAYDVMGRITQVSLPGGIVAPIQRNSAGGVTSLGMGTGSRTQTLDSRGRITAVTSPANRSTSVTYNDLGQMSSITRPDGSTMTLERHASGSISRMTLADGTSTSYSINNDGQVTGVTDPNGGTWSRSYDSVGRLNGWSTPSGAAWAISFDEMGHITSVQSPVGTTTVEHDAAGRRTSILYPDGIRNTYTYDAAGRLTGVDDINFLLDARGDIVGANGVTGTRGPQGRLETVTLPGGQQVTYQYDAAGRLATITDWAGGAVSYTYNDQGRLDKTVRSSGVATTYAWDADGMLHSVDEKKDNVVLAGVSVSRNMLGNIVSASRTLPVVIDRVPRTETATYDADGRISGFNYDASGRLLADSDRSYQWNGADRLKQVASLAFEYDGLHEIRQIGTRSFVVSYLYDVPRPVTESVNGSAVWHYVYAPSGQPVFRVSESDSSRQYFHFDEIGNATILTDEAGSTVAAWSFDPYGAVTGMSGNVTDSPFLFAGGFGVMAVGEGELYRMGARIYDAKSTRFLTPDPAWDSLDPQAIDPYTYAAQNPLRFVDPFGTTPADAAEGSSFWLDAAGFINGVASAGSTISDWVTGGFGNSGVAGLMDDIRGTKPLGGLEKYFRGKTVDAARDVTKFANAGNAKGAKNAAAVAKGFNAEAKAAASANSKVGKLGAAATIAGVALTSYEAKGRFDKIDTKMDKELDLASRMYDSSIKALTRSLKRGTITRERFQQLVKIARETNQSQIDAINDGHFYDALYEGTRYLIKSGETFIPLPPGISIGDGFGWLGSKIFGTPIPK